MKRKEIEIWLPLLRTLKPESRYLVGVSGGRDSIVLLQLLIDAGFSNLIVAHLDHRLRGRASTADARFVERTARRLKLKCEIGATDVQELAKKEKGSLELAGRQARHTFFEKTSRKHRAVGVFLGHHADDLVETLLINLFRGTGLAGLASLREKSEIIIRKRRLILLRPLLHVWRDEIDGFVAKRALTFREDASNTDTLPLRNRIRRRVIPYLERTLERNVRQSLWRCAMIAAEEEALIDALIPAHANTTMSVVELRELPVAAQRRAVANWLRANSVAHAGFDVVERVRSLVEVNALAAKVNLPRDRHVRRRAKKLFIE